jgi:hypothetical protein
MPANFPVSGETNMSKLDYLVMLLLIYISGNQVFCMEGRQERLLILVCCLFGVLFLMYHRNLSSRFVITALAFCAILALQCITFNFLPLITIAGFFTRLLIGYTAVCLVRNFTLAYVNIMFYICVLSFCFYIPDVILSELKIDFRSFFEPLRTLFGVESRFNILVHNFQPEPDAYRNAGFFWEPGALAGYILLAVMLLGLQKEKYSVPGYRKTLAVFFITLLTTFSTTGYILLPLCLLLHIDLTNISRQKSPQILIVLTSVIFLFVAFYHLDFVGAKIEHQYDQAKFREGNWELGRVGTILYDLEFIKIHPFLGWGPHSKTLYTLNQSETIAGQGNGLTDFTCKFGLLGLVLYSVCIWKGIFNLTGSRTKAFLFLLFTLLVLNGEAFLNFPLFLGLMFVEMKTVTASLHPTYPVYRRSNFSFHREKIYCPNRVN